MNSFVVIQGHLPPREISPRPGRVKNFNYPFQASSSSPKHSSTFTARAFGRQDKALLFPTHCFLGKRPKALSPAKPRDDSDGGESLILDAEALERDLTVAIAEENYAEAAKIRDSLKLLGEDRKACVLAANARFYEAFRAGDLAAMQGLWAKTDEACCVHPGARGISGYEDVITSWEYVWANYEFPLDIELKDVLVRVRGDLGYVTCVELVRTKGSSWGGQFVTNVFERVDGHWLISVHHASPIDL